MSPIVSNPPQQHGQLEAALADVVFTPANPEVNVELLLAKMSLKEKLSLLAGSYFWGTSGVERLDIPAIKVTDGPNGARGSIVFDGTPAACFPASVSLAATFNKSLARRIGKAIGQEALTKGATVLMGPTVCIHRSPLGGRNFESFSEDPLLAGLLAAEFISGLQTEDVAACLKHFAANEQETKRNTINQIISERALREIYLRPFELAIKQASPWAVMTSFPKINGVHCDMDEWLLKDVLRGEWKWDGMIMSDWEGTNSTVESLNAGLDLEMPGPTRRRSLSTVSKAIDLGFLTESVIDERARRILNLLVKTRKFGDRKTSHLDPERAVDLPEHRALIREAGAEGVVLLKNTGNVLPIDSGTIKSIAILGPLAKYTAAHGGGSAMLTPHYKISPWDALYARIGSSTELIYGQGTNIDRVYPALEDNVLDRNGLPGFTVSYFPDHEFASTPTHQHLAKAKFLSMMNSPIEKPQSVRLSGIFQPLVTGNHYLSFSTMGPSKLLINNELVYTQSDATEDVLAFVFGVQNEAHFQFNFVAGVEYHIVVETRAMASKASAKSDEHVHSLLDGVLGIHVGFQLQSYVEADLIAEAVAAAQAADVAIVFVGNTTQWEAEGADMKTMNLPSAGSQDALIMAVSAVNSRTIVLNTTGVAIDARAWIGNVAAFASAWYAGQETGNAIADVLLGEVCPSGRLPITWPRRIEDVASYGNFGWDTFAANEVEYVEGVNVGYRDADRWYGTEREALFSFGYGLSYTTFSFSNVNVQGRLEEEDAIVCLEVSNTGKRSGAEVVQVYLHRAGASEVDRPIKELVGFEKVFLEVSESKLICIRLVERAGAYWNEIQKEWTLENGEWEFLIGTSSRPEDLAIRIPSLVQTRKSWTA